MAGCAYALRDYIGSNLVDINEKNLSTDYADYVDLKTKKTKKTKKRVKKGRV